MPRERAVGDRIAGRYEVYDVLHGGMSAVLLALDLRSPDRRTRVAVKIVRPDLPSHPVRYARFAAECRLWAALGTHPNVVRAIDAGEEKGDPFVVLEFVTGGDLRSLVGTPSLDPLSALKYTYQACLGMEHAARGGLRCHRDLKPGNLLLGPDGNLKITDFGLARLRDDYLGSELGPKDAAIPLVEDVPPQRIEWTDAADRADGFPLPWPTEPTRPPISPPREPEPFDPESTAAWEGMAAPADDATPSRLTTTGAMLGTAIYMAPEQFENAKGVDARADIYSLGVVLYEMLAGAPPFRGRTLDALRRGHERYDPPPLEFRLPRRLERERDRIEAIVLRCLSKDPDDRFASFVELRRALLPILRAGDPKFRPNR